LSGELNGSGASSQESAMDAWRSGFQNANPDVTVSYDPVGSGGGRTAFLDGSVQFAGTDSALNEDVLTQDRKSKPLNSGHHCASRMPSSPSKKKQQLIQT